MSSTRMFSRPSHLLPLLHVHGSEIISPSPFTYLTLTSLLYRCDHRAGEVSPIVGSGKSGRAGLTPFRAARGIPGSGRRGATLTTTPIGSPSASAARRNERWGAVFAHRRGSRLAGGCAGRRSRLAGDGSRQSRRLRRWKIRHLVAAWSGSTNPLGG